MIPVVRSTQEDLNEVVEEFTEHSADLLVRKGQEYATEEDRLKNFRTVAEMMDLDPTEVCMNYLLKHMQSLALAVRTGDYDWNWRTDDGDEGLKQRVADGINYLFLLAAILEAKEGYRREGARYVEDDDA